MRFASSALRASGFVQRIALRCRAHSSIACSCTSFGSPTTTTSVSGWAIACSRSVDVFGTPFTSTDLEQAIAHPETDVVVRSEEHTSELQSHVNLVCRLLLDKKKA